VVVFMGDGTMGQGIVYESFNIAARHALPVLFVLEDNQFAQTTPKALAHAGELATRAASFEIPSEQVDGNDVMAVYEVAQQAVQQVRQECRPYFLVLNTYRLGPHSKGDDNRSEEELALHRQNDPLLQTAQMLSQTSRKSIEQVVDNRVTETIEGLIG